MKIFKFIDSHRRSENVNISHKLKILKLMHSTRTTLIMTQLHKRFCLFIFEPQIKLIHTHKPQSMKENIFNEILIGTKHSTFHNMRKSITHIIIYEKNRFTPKFSILRLFLKQDKQKIDYSFESGRSLNTQLPELCTNSQSKGGL